MELRELRIGNVIRSKVSGITGRPTIPWEILEEDVVNIISNGIDNYEPIHLTVDWLLRFGFENSSLILSEYYIDCFTVWCKNGIYFICNDGNIKPKLEYVHQLQNLYFALTGKELELSAEIKK